MRWGWVDIQRNPLGLVEVRTGAKRKRLPTIITMEQYQKLLQRGEARRTLPVMVQLAMCLGLRVSGILGLPMGGRRLAEWNRPYTALSCR